MSEKLFNDQRIILNTLGEFARILDRKQWTRVGEVFADDIAFNYGDGQEQQGIAALHEQFTKFLDHCGATQHLLGSVQLELNEDEAVTRSYVQARHQGIGDKAHLFFDTNGEYTDRWQRRAQGWRIVRRDARWDLFMGDPAVLFH
jgi:ketosteroid isomerase-like protein